MIRVGLVCQRNDFSKEVSCQEHHCIHLVETSIDLRYKEEQRDPNSGEWQNKEHKDSHSPDNLSACTPIFD